MRQLRKCSYVVTATFLDHDKVQKTDLKPLQPVWSVSTKCLRIDSTKYSCVQFDVQFSTSVVNKLHCTFAWICVDFSWKTAFISYHVMSAKTCVLKCCCLLFDWPEFWESSPLLNRESWWAYGDVREKTAFLMFSQHPAWVITHRKCGLVIRWKWYITLTVFDTHFCFCIEVSRKIVCTRKRKTNCTTIMSFPWSVL